MLDAMTPAEFDERYAATQVPTEADWKWATLATYLHNIQALIRLGFSGGKADVSFAEPSEFVGEKPPKQGKPTGNEVEQMEAAAAAFFGPTQ